jgi:hypothetical protein
MYIIQPHVLPFLTFLGLVWFMQAIGFCGMQQLRTQQKDGHILVEYTLDFKMNLLRAAFSLVSSSD